MTGQCNLNTIDRLKSTRHRCDTQPRRAITEASYYMQGQMRQATTGASRSPVYMYNAPARFLLSPSYYISPRCTPLLLYILGEGGRRICSSLLSSLLWPPAMQIHIIYIQ